jgi:hypothetical protein
VSEVERRGGNGSPPTVIMLAYQAMDADLKRLLQKVGIGLVIFGVVMPMAIEPFIELSWVYWTFSLVVLVIGTCLLWPPIGIWVGNLLAGLAVKLVPATKDVLMPDRRARE